MPTLFEFDNLPGVFLFQPGDLGVEVFGLLGRAFKLLPAERVLCP